LDHWKNFRFNIISPTALQLAKTNSYRAKVFFQTRRNPRTTIIWVQWRGDHLYIARNAEGQAMESRLIDHAGLFARSVTCAQIVRKLGCRPDRQGSTYLSSSTPLCWKTLTVTITHGYALQQTHHRVTRKGCCHML